MAKKPTRDELLLRMAKRIERMERDAAALGREIASVPEFYYTAEVLVGDIQRIGRDVQRLVAGEPI